MWKRMASSFFVALFLLTGTEASAQQEPETQTFHLNKIEVSGLQKVGREKFIEVSGLQLGQSLKFADLKTASNKIFESGLFARVNYRYNWDGDKLDVIFEVEERRPPEPNPSLAVPKTPVLGKIEFSGLQRLEPAAAADATRLQLSAVIDQQQLKAAAKRLAETGYFSEIDYSYRETDGQWVVMFEVTEFKWDVPCVFDNFIWFTPQELRDAVRKQIPEFDGAVAEHEAFPRKIKAALEELLRQRGIQREVNFTIGIGDLDTPGSGIRKEFIFISFGAPMPVCKVSFPGASAALDKQLQAGIKPLMKGDYSSQQFAQYIENMLLPIYRQRGYLRAKFSGVSAQPNADANKKCQGGVNILAQVEEGAVYKLGKFEWVGNQALAVSTMQDLFGMKAKATADGAKIDKGLNAIKTAYLNQGYFDLKLTVETDFDESVREANYRIIVEEGKSFRMGEVLIKNASENEEKRIRGKWQLAEGAVLNYGYVKEFVKKLAEDRSGRTPRVRLQADRAKQTMNVLFTF
jgi:outer membrane protein assembly factor BamA